MRQSSNWITDYQRFTANSEAPDNFHFWTAISVLAGALRRHVWVDMGHFQWTPCFYIVFVAPPGIVSKTTTANVGMNLLREVPGIHFGPDVVTWQSLVQSLAQSTEAFEFEKDLHPMSTVTIVSGEFGTFLNPNDREMVDVLVSLWDGQIGKWKKATKTSGSDEITNPWINIIACTTPAWIQGNFPEYMIGGGFTSRTIFVYAEEKRRLVAYPFEEMAPEDLKRKLIRDLEHISVELVGPYKVTPEAIRWGQRWYERLYEENKDTLAHDRFAGYIARKQTHMHKLALILSAAERDTLEINEHFLRLADEHLQQAEEHQQKVFSRIVAPEARPANLLIDVMSRSPRMSKQALFSAVFQQMSQTQFDEALNAGIAAGMLRCQQRGQSLFVEFIGDPNGPGTSQQSPNAVSSGG